MEIVVFIFLLIAFVSGTILGLFIQKRSQSKWLLKMEQDIEILRKERANDDEKVSTLMQEKEALFSENKVLKERLEIFENRKEADHKQLQEQFENLANRILKSNSDSFSKDQQERLTLLLKPFKEKLESFEKRVEDTHREELKESSSLKEQLKQLQELNQKISKEATELTQALLGQSKTRGNWGEMILESVLEKSGLVKNQEYHVQQSFTTADGRRLQPDVVIQLPDNKHLVIDSKLSLNAYERFVNEEDPSARDLALRNHIQSVRQHIKELGQKDYQKLYGLDSLDFVLMFVPVEPAFNAAVSQDTSLYNEAFERNIIMVSHSTLLATLRTVASIWRQEKQNRNAMKIADEGGKLYDKLSGFVNTMDDLGKRVKQLDEGYDKAMNQLIRGRGNLVTRAEKMKKLGADTSRQIDGAQTAEDEED